MKKYDAIVVGAGHAGLEAAFACAHMGHPTLLITLNMNFIHINVYNRVSKQKTEYKVIEWLTVST